ncbi:phage holin family protein [Paenibacillus taiwanensis]|uniref:phage holin family protein n=1 Tax=Paenibacillus taiwanensis TaxID=401638 RepID=UPI0004019945|nr:phage holin family protein [Paenibacillus taiwanensis]
MERFDILIKWILAAVSSTIAYLFGETSSVIGVLAALACIDYVSGVAAAAFAGKLVSRTGLIGIARKAYMFAMVSVGHLVDSILGDAHMFREMIAFFYIANELLSIVENGGSMGAPIPPAIRQAIAILQGKGDNPRNLLRNKPQHKRRNK